MSKELEYTIPYTQLALDNFWKFIFERHNIWHKRFILEQPAPWTTDRVLKDFKFTNVYRELDRGTMFLLDNILTTGEPIEQVFNIIIYRMFNRIETYQAIGFQRSPWNPKPMFGALRVRQAANLPLYTDAHIVCAYASFPGRDKLARFEYILDDVYKNLPDLMHVIHNSTSLAPIHRKLMTMQGVGPFNAYEVAVDVSYAEWNLHNENEWVNPGPGCMRGLKQIFGVKENERECIPLIFQLRDRQESEFDRLKLPFRAIAYNGKSLTLRNVEHSLCEYFKWCKAMDGTGRPRNVFRSKASKEGGLLGDNGFQRLKG